jgi:hypothetical protein
MTHAEMCKRLGKTEDEVFGEMLERWKNTSPEMKAMIAAGCCFVNWNPDLSDIRTQPEENDAV